MVIRAFCLLLALLLVPIIAQAQDNLAPDGKVWVQVTTESDLDLAVREARRYASEFEFTRIFATSDGHFAIALGVVDVREADEMVRSLIRRRSVPRDTLTTEGQTYSMELWSAKRLRIDDNGFLPEFAEVIKLDRSLSDAQRRAIQSALIWSGDHKDVVDGKIGPRTRLAIRSFQRHEELPETGYLSYDEIDRLVAARDRTQRAVGWREVEDGPLGLRIGLAAALFAAPQQDDLGLRLAGRDAAEGAILSLISLDEGRRSLDDLYQAARNQLGEDLVETRGPSGFSLRSERDGRILHSFARRQGQDVRAFILSFGTDLAPLLDPVAYAMQASLEIRSTSSRPRLADELARPTPREDRPEPRVAPEREETPRLAERSGSGQASDRPRTRRDPRPRTETRPRREEPRRDRPRTRREDERRDRPRIRRDDRDVDSTGTGFYVSPDGKILTNHHVVRGCRRMIVDGNDEVEVLAVDRKHDLALLDHRVERNPEEYARFSPDAPRLNSDVTVVGFPLYGLLGGLNVTRGVVSSLKGLQGNEIFIQISAEVQPGNSGGPALDPRGFVVGVVQSKLDALKVSERTQDIPQNVNFAIRRSYALKFLQEQNVNVETGTDRDPLHPSDLAEQAQRYTVLLECIK